MQNFLLIGNNFLTETSNFDYSEHSMMFIRSKNDDILPFLVLRIIKFKIFFNFKFLKKFKGTYPILSKFIQNFRAFLIITTHLYSNFYKGLQLFLSRVRFPGSDYQELGLPSHRLSGSPLSGSGPPPQDRLLLIASGDRRHPAVFKNFSELSQVFLKIKNFLDIQTFISIIFDKSSRLNIFRSFHKNLCVKQ